ncbi:MAG TPA: ABC transporter substrate-binding protein [Feifaniaceae bacterium]|nr:ABC transporter substrate-binding protein [Feifaniaceae bacterium]
MMKRGTKFIALLATVLLLLVTVVGCLPAPAAVNGSQSREEETTAADAASGETTEDAAAEPAVDLTVAMDPAERTPQTLEVWYAVSGTSGEKFTEQATTFDESSDLVSLNLSYSGGANDTATKVSAALLTGTQPDVALMYAGPSFTGSLGNFDMAQLIQREGFDKDDIYPGIWDYCKYFNGEICAVPYGISTPVMYYNKDILAAAGVDMTNPPKTWDEFYDVCLKCLESGNINGMEGFTAFDVTETGWLFKSMCMQNGCPVVEVEDGVITPVFNSPEALEVAEYWKTLVDAGIMGASEHSAAENKFLSGNLAFVVMSSNRMSRWTDVDINIGAIEMPYFKQQSVALGGNVLVIFTQDPQKIEAAWDLITFLLAPEQNLDFALSTGYLPVRQSELATDAVTNATSQNEMYAVAFKQLSYAWAYVHFEQMGTMDLQIADALSRIEKGTKTPQVALDDALNKLVTEMEFDAQ